MKRFALFLCLCLTACSGGSSSGGGTGGEFDVADCDNLDQFVAPADVNSWAYWITEPDLATLEASDADLLVIDYSADGSSDEEFTAQQITDLKASGDGKTVLAYMSIGEAEVDRFYWDPAWVDGDGAVTDAAPSWLAESNPDFPDNYKVHYWESDWQDVIFGDTDGANKSYLDRIIDAGFDGIYLDIIDAFEYFGPDGESGLDRDSAGEDMIDFVEAIAAYARDTRGVANFLVFPQNGAPILDQESGCAYLAAVNGIGAEDTFYFGDEENDNDLDLDHAEEVTPYLDAFVEAGKMVLSVDYVQDEDKIADFYERALEHSYLPYVSVRNLDQLYPQP